MKLRNNNKKVVRDIARQTYRKNRGKNRILICAAAFAVVLIFSAFSFAAGKLESMELADIRRGGMEHCYSLERPGKEQQEIINRLPYIRYTGRQWNFASAQKQGIPVFFCAAFEEKTFQMIYEPALTGICGTFPKTEDEIMLPLAALHNLDIEHPHIGMNIRLKLVSENQDSLGQEQKQTGSAGNGKKGVTKTFTLSGYFREYNTDSIINQLPTGFFSIQSLKQFQNHIPSARKEPDILYILPKQRLADMEAMQKEEEALRQATGAGQDQMLSGYYNQADKGEHRQALLECTGISLLALLLAGMLVHNVTDISLSSDIRWYGTLKTLGATGKQIQNILLRQALKAGLTGALAGGAAGWMIGLVVLPLLLQILYLGNYGQVEASIGFHPVLLAVAVLLALLMTLVSGMRPVIRLSRLTPTEAQRWKGRGRRDRKQSLMAILLLTFGILSALSAAMITDGFDDKEEIEQEPDFGIFAYTIWQPDEGELLDKDTRTEICRIPGITRARYVYVNSFMPDMSEPVWKPLRKYGDQIQGHALLVTENNIRSLEQYAEKTEKKLDIEGLRAGEKALILHTGEFTNKDERQAEELGETSFSIADRKGISCGEIKPAGLIDRREKGFPKLRLPMHSRHEPILLMTKEGFRRAGLTPVVQDMELQAALEKEPAVKERLKEILRDRNRQILKETGNSGALTYSAKSDSNSANTRHMAAMRLMAYSITGLLLVLGILNYINTMAADIFARSRELALLECAGMTRMQQRRMLIKEGLQCSIVVIFLSFGASFLLLPLLCRLIRLKYVTFQWEYPLLHLAVMSLMLILCSILIPIFLYKKETSQTIAERLRHV